MASRNKSRGLDPTGTIPLSSVGTSSTLANNTASAITGVWGVFQPCKKMLQLKKSGETLKIEVQAKSITLLFDKASTITKFQLVQAGKKGLILPTHPISEKWQ